MHPARTIRTFLKAGSITILKTRVLLTIITSCRLHKVRVHKDTLHKSSRAQATHNRQTGKKEPERAERLRQVYEVAEESRINVRTEYTWTYGKKPQLGACPQITLITSSLEAWRDSGTDQRAETEHGSASTVNRSAGGINTNWHSLYKSQNFLYQGPILVRKTRFPDSTGWSACFPSRRSVCRGLLDSNNAQIQLQLKFWHTFFGPNWPKPTSVDIIAVPTGCQ